MSTQSVNSGLAGACKSDSWLRGQACADNFGLQALNTKPHQSSRNRKTEHVRHLAARLRCSHNCNASWRAWVSIQGGRSRNKIN